MVVKMEADGNMLQEVEIVQQGFGTKSRLSNVASISQVNGLTLRQSPTSTVQNALAGRLPGLFSYREVDNRVRMLLISSSAVLELMQM